jgi:hypothetical protein
LSLALVPFPEYARWAVDAWGLGPTFIGDVDVRIVADLATDGALTTFCDLNNLGGILIFS